MIILDISANTHKNDLAYITKMLEELKKVDTGKHEIVIKGQLFKECGKNIVCTKTAFEHMHDESVRLGYKCTASVFDEESLDYLLNFDIPFVKIACRKDLYYLAGEVPRRVSVIASVPDSTFSLDCSDIKYIYCVSNYPATMEEYASAHLGFFLEEGISDHTENWDLYKKYKPEILECHYALEDSTGLDKECGICRTPKMLKEIL